MMRTTNYLPPLRFLTIVLVALSVAFTVYNNAWIHLLATLAALYPVYLMVQSRTMLVAVGGMLSPHDRAYQMGFTDFRPAMPKDVIAYTWGYNAVTPHQTGWPTVKWWSEAGITTVLGPWYDERNIRGWAQVFAKARRRGWPCKGMIDTHWHNRSNYKETAICAWRVPRKGERRYLELRMGGE